MSNIIASIPSEGVGVAVLFLVFNRPDTTREVFEAIRKAKPVRLYIAADGARKSALGELEKVAEVRHIVSFIDWPCEVKTLFRSENLGCKLAISSAINWFFENEEQGIILEDDCLPHADFFPYCETLLRRYAKDDRVWAITGNNFQSGQQRGPASYYFSKYFHCWGWASWRRAWVNFDSEMTYWPEWSQSADWKKTMVDVVERKYWNDIFNMVFSGDLNTCWDYQWLASIWHYKGAVITPNVNLVSNIGFGPGATHTVSISSEWANMTVDSIEVTSHPRALEIDLVADRHTFDHHFGGREQRLPSVVRFFRRAFRYVKRNYFS